MVNELIPGGGFSYPKRLYTGFEAVNAGSANDKDAIVMDFFSGFRVIIMTVANSQVNTKVLELLPKFKIKKMNRWCFVL